MTGDDGSLALLLGSSIVALTAPVLLRQLGAGAANPVAVIVCWVLAALGVSITVCLGLAIMAVPGYAAGSTCCARSAPLSPRLRYLAVVTEPPSLVGRLSRCRTLGVLFAVPPLLTAAVLLRATSALAIALP